MAAKYSVFPLLRQISLKYACTQKVPARLFTACARQSQSAHGAKWAGSANILPRMFGGGIFQSRNASSDGRSNARPSKPVSEEEDEDDDGEEFDADELDVDEESESESDNDFEGNIDDIQSEED